MSSTASADSYSGGLERSFAHALEALQVDEPIICVDDLVVTTTPQHEPLQPHVIEDAPSAIDDPAFPAVLVGAASLLAILIFAALLAF